jgi:possible DNA-directed DNA polymerase III delta subunit
LQLEESPTKIRSLIKNNVEKLLLVREKLTEGLSERDIARALSMEPWRVKKYTVEARTYTLQALRDLFHALLRLEEEIRKGKIKEQLALELLLLGEEKAYFN